MIEKSGSVTLQELLSREGKNLLSILPNLRFSVNGQKSADATLATIGVVRHVASRTDGMMVLDRFTADGSEYPVIHEVFDPQKSQIFVSILP